MKNLTIIILLLLVVAPICSAKSQIYQEAEVKYMPALESIYKFESFNIELHNELADTTVSFNQYYDHCIVFFSTYTDGSFFIDFVFAGDEQPYHIKYYTTSSLAVLVADNKRIDITTVVSDNLPEIIPGILTLTYAMRASAIQHVIDVKIWKNKFMNSYILHDVTVVDTQIATRDDLQAEINMALILK